MAPKKSCRFSASVWIHRHTLNIHTFLHQPEVSSVENHGLTNTELSSLSWLCTHSPFPAHSPAQLPQHRPIPTQGDAMAGRWHQHRTPYPLRSFGSARARPAAFGRAHGGSSEGGKAASFATLCRRLLPGAGRGDGLRHQHRTEGSAVALPVKHRDAFSFWSPAKWFGPTPPQRTGRSRHVGLNHRAAERGELQP